MKIINKKNIPLPLNPVCLLLIMLFSAAILTQLSASPTTTVYVYPSTKTVKVGQTFTIDIRISDVIDLYGWEFKLGWNPNLLDVVDVTEGPFLKQGGETFFTKKINDTEGYILVDCTLLGNVSGVSGEGTLAYVKFYAEIQGSCVLDLYDTELVSSVEQPIDHIAEDGSVTVSKSVGGVIIPVSKLELLAPWIGSASTITFALATIAVLVKRKKKGKRNTKRRMKKRGSRKTLVWGLLCFFLIILICYAIYSFSNSSNVNAPQASCLKVAIVDHLSLSQPNQTFIQTSTNILETAGFTVDYYKGEEVTVEFYRNLPTHDYGLIILRVHSALRADRGPLGAPPVALFTSEPYSKTKYVYEQFTDQVICATFYEGEESKASLYFGIQPEFVKHSMKGKFQKTIIIMMGCDGLRYTYMAEAFIEKGASAYIGWNSLVLASHTDLATTHLLQHFIIEKQTLKEAWWETFKEVGPDPSHRSSLLYYPLEAENYTMQGIIAIPTPNIAEIETRPVLGKMKGCGIPV